MVDYSFYGSLIEDKRFRAIPYHGYEVQPHPSGWYYVIDKKDTRYCSEVRLPSITKAMKYIDNLSKEVN